MNTLSIACLKMIKIISILLYDFLQIDIVIINRTLLYKYYIIEFLVMNTIMDNPHF